MTKALTTNQQAVELRDFLGGKKIKNQLQMALPKWLSPDRLLRVVFTAALRNPKILECTKESILQSVMMCAQLGLEPIMGRAHLIPYRNSKKIDGRWVKVMECQMQPGYQGLIDLARRSGVISDVYGSVVYDTDTFDIEYGTDRRIIHKPDFINEPGEIIGAYVVWELKDGTKHPEFMPLRDIYKRRAKSQSYQWAETGDPKKGGGKRDSVWHQWPEDQMVKTVIKHSSKMVPASIEFMEAVTVDNEVDVGEYVSPFDAQNLLPEQAGPTEAELIAEFDRVVSESGLKKCDEFLQIVSKSNELTIDQSKAQIAGENDYGNFVSAYDKWEKAQHERSGGPGGDDNETNGAGNSKTRTINWRPEDKKIQKTYSPEKQAVLIKEAEKLGITENMKPAEMHQAILNKLDAGTDGDADGDTEGRGTDDADAEQEAATLERFNDIYTQERNTPAWHYAQGETLGDENSQFKPIEKAAQWLVAYDDYKANEKF